MHAIRTFARHRLSPIALIVFCCGFVAVAAAHADERPNLVVLFTDDQRCDAVGYSGNTAVSTPNLDRLARAGVVFENCFVNTSICAISRANLLTGQYPARHGVVDFFRVLSPEQLDRTAPGRLQAAGYQTAFFGKWGIGDSPSSTILGAQVFDYWAGQPMQTCFFHESDCRYVNADGFRRDPADLCDCPADSDGRVGYRNRIGREGLVKPLHVDADVVPRHVDRFLDGRDDEKPFCMMVFFKAPHSPFEDWAPEFESATDGLVMPTPPSATLDNAKREPNIVRRSLGSKSGMKYLTEPESLDRHLRDYYRLISSMDAGVGKIVEHLRRRGLDDNTVFLFTSDNGHFKGEHGLAGKWLMYEPSLRVPGFLYDPRRRGGFATRKMVTTIDFTATLLSLAGVDVPADMDGRDLTVLADDPTADWRDDFYYTHPYVHNNKLPHTEGVRTERYCYTRYLNATPVLEQLFDLHTDPNQLANLAGDPQHADLLSELRSRCDDLARRSGPVRENIAATSR
ncbi:MAG: sulfatase-like hydrolase/transferase [Planctomycetota bacterium]